jgi:peroxiredoxin
MTEQVQSVDFTAPAVIEGEISQYSFEGEGKSVLLFFPGAFTDVCEEELCSFQDSLSDFQDLDAEVIGISVDTPFSLKEFAEQNDLEFRLVSDHAKQIVKNYGVETDFAEMGYYGLAERAVFIVEEGEVVWSKVMDDPHQVPEVEEVREALR